jgi:alkanesulfonate monooxygenase SsuD/methylene tetrahydromethanopterin reductase-like flavin-dependent oxidoreductase (luciferase family)
MLDLYIALHTKRIRVGQLGIVLPAQNPLRVAEDIAMLDHMSGGRANAGFARGYQRRWVDVMGQQMHSIHGVTPGQHDEIDQANRAAFEEHFQIVKQAWTQDMIEYHGKYWQVPPAGTPWEIEATQQWGAGVDGGIVRQIGVVPKPLQKPHPPLFQPFASSEATIRWCAREHVTAILPPMHYSMANQLYNVYSEEAQANGRSLGPGEGLGLLRDVVVCDTDEEALQLWQQGGAFCGAAWFAPFGFWRGFTEPGKQEMLSVPEQLERGLVLVGSPDTVSRQVETILKNTPMKWLFAWTYNGLIPHDKILRSLELFSTKVLPRFS